MKTITMRNAKLLKIRLIIVIMTLISCLKDDDYNIPKLLGNEENAQLQEIIQELQNGGITEISLSELLGLYKGQVTLIESDIVTKGYVTSSDRTGNFYKEFYMQDVPENPTVGINVVLNQLDSYNQFNIGREVYIKLKGLYLGKNALEVLTIGGTVDGDHVGQITANQIPNHIFRSKNTMEIVPLGVPPSLVDDSHLGMFLAFENVQFDLDLQGKTFLDPNDDFDTQRNIRSCDSDFEFPIETSSFANFTQVPLPLDAKGTLSGIITQSYGGKEKVMVLNDIDDIDFTDARCDPVFFDTFSQGNLNNWTIYSTLGDETWYYNSYGNPRDSATMSGFNGENQPNDDWLISNAIDLSPYSAATLTFQSVVRYSGPSLEVYMSTNYKGGDPNSDGTWVMLNANLDTNTGSWSSWKDSGDIDVSEAVGGNLFIAFRYRSTVTGSSTYEIDNVKVRGE
ncbi:DUF5689 domain-containing protein [Aestuariivivens sediminis]|uniref:DUF5689 domain-containing protein n=1 Tax=Aestuariivivens sediminis TaxID=2913557 RepID=UPI001F5677AB|nr:DUF5689 domain-containing protein [Aestuariivivens sediminis]